MNENYFVYWFFHGSRDSKHAWFIICNLREYFMIHLNLMHDTIEFINHLLIVLYIEIFIFSNFEKIVKGVLSLKIKVFSILPIILIVCLSINSVPVLADAALVPGYYTQESVNDVFSGDFNDNVNRNDEAKRIYEATNGSVSISDLELINNIDFSTYTNGYSLFVLINSSGIQVYIINLLANYDYLPCIIKQYRSDSVNVNQNVLCYPITNYNTSVSLDSYTISNGSLSSVTHGSLEKDWGSNTYGYYIHEVPSTLLYCSNILGIYSGKEAYSVAPVYGNSFSYRTLTDNVYHGVADYEFTNYWSESLPYYDGSQIVDPDNPGSDVESNENHMYFKSCEIGFAEPSGVNSYNSFGGAYFYIKYTVDDWVRTHINDYDLYFSSTALVGSRQVNGSKRVSLDSDGCICIPFSDIFSGNSSLLSEGFVIATSNSRVEQNFYKSYLYSVSSEKLPFLVDKFNSVDNNSLSGAWDKLLDVYFGNWLLAYTSTGFTQVITDTTMAAIQSVINYYANFKIQTQCYLIDNNDNRSGSVGRIFDLATGSDTSTDNEGLTNDNPYVDDSTGDDYLPDIPTENTYPVTTGQNGTYIQNNLSIPSQYTITYRDGVNEFIDWFNQDPEVTGIQNSFWGALGVFKGNPASELYQEYFGFLPAGFKSIIFGCAGVGIIGAAATILRKRLMK